MRSCREFHQKTAEHQFVAVNQSAEMRSALVFFATPHFLAALRETSLHRVGHGITPGSEHPRQSRASHGCDWPHFRGSDSHLGISGEAVETSFNTQCAFRQLWKKIRWCVLQTHVHRVGMEAREGSDPEDKAEFRMAATGHLFQDVMATCHPPVMLETLRKHHPTHSVPSDSS